MKLVVLSYTTLMRELNEGGLTEKMLNQALFYLDVPKSYALNPASCNGEECNLLRNVTLDHIEQRRLRNILKRVVKKAEVEHRIYWIKDFFEQSYGVFDDLLAANHLERLDFSGARGMWDEARIEEIVIKSRVPIQILWK